MSFYCDAPSAAVAVVAAAAQREENINTHSLFVSLNCRVSTVCLD